ADGGDGAGGAGVPVGQVAALRHLVRAEHAHVEVAAAHHGEGVGVVEVGRAGQFGDRLFAGVDEVGVDLVAFGGRAHAEHAVLGVQGDAGVGRQVVGDRGGLADAEVDERAARDVAGDDGGQFRAAERLAIQMLDGTHAASSAFRSRIRST